MSGKKQQVEIYYWDYQSESGSASPGEHELQVRLVERVALHDPEWQNVNAMAVDWRDKGKIFWEPDMSKIDLLIQFKLLKGADYVGSVSFPLREIFRPGKDFKQWLTVFDTVEDDIFDGIVGIDDDETPRIRVGFTLKSEDTHSDVREPAEVAEPKRKSVKDSNRIHEDHKAVRGSLAAPKSKDEMLPKRSPSQGEAAPPKKGPAQTTQSQRQSSTVTAGSSVVPTKTSVSKRPPVHQEIVEHPETDSRRGQHIKETENEHIVARHENADKISSSTNTKTPDRYWQPDSGTKKSSKTISSSQKKREAHETHGDEGILNDSRKDLTGSSSKKDGGAKAGSGTKIAAGSSAKEVRSSQDFNQKKTNHKTNTSAHVSSAYHSNLADSMQSRDSVALKAFQSDRSVEDHEMKVSELAIEQEK